MGIHWRRWGIILCLSIYLLVGACTGSSAPIGEEATAPDSALGETTAATSATSEPETTTPEPDNGATSPTNSGNLPTLTGTATVELQVNGNRIVIEVDGDHAPVTAGNFVDLVERGVYDNLVFHRVVREPEPFVVQGGDPQSADPTIPPQRWGTGSFIDPDTNEPRLIPLEIQPAEADQPIYGQTLQQARVSDPPQLRHTRGAVAMARSQVPNSASSQFYITLTDLPFLDGSYAVFGYVTEGMEVVDAIQQGDVIESATVLTGLDNLQQPG
jgi:peptidyl-prolyl cis-trans isomerase B (cyclophilin B)